MCALLLSFVQEVDEGFFDDKGRVNEVLGFAVEVVAPTDVSVDVDPLFLLIFSMMVVKSLLDFLKLVCLRSLSLSLDAVL
jgi:hypothetical protein